MLIGEPQRVGNPGFVWLGYFKYKYRVYNGLFKWVR